MMDKTFDGKRQAMFLAVGMLGCLLLCTGDWLMIYGDTTAHGTIYWLTEGTAKISPIRNSLSMLVAFPAVICYGVALFSLENFITDEKGKRIYHWLNVYGLTPWMALHLLYVMIFYLYHWMTEAGHADLGLQASEALFRNFSWIVLVSETMMLPVFIWWLVLVLRGKTILEKSMAPCHVLIFYGILNGIKELLPMSPFRLGFTNGLMSESMFLFFGGLLIWSLHREGKRA